MNDAANLEKRALVIEQSRVLVEESMTSGVLSSKHIQARINMIQDAVRSVFKKDVHYGTIPGTKKPTLYQPGADQILVMFKIAAAEPKVEDLSTPDSIRYRITRSGVNQLNGVVLGVGVGECSSDEEKYKWRKPVCEQEFQETPEDRRREVWKTYQQKTYKVKQVRMNPADVANTILKMADKRAKIAMTLVVTGAADAFNQDLEELPPEVREQLIDEEERGANGQAPARTAPPPAADGAGPRRISEKQAGRFFAICKSAAKAPAAISAFLNDTYGIELGEGDPAPQLAAKMTVDVYEKACAWAASK